MKFTSTLISILIAVGLYYYVTRWYWTVWGKLAMRRYEA